MSKSAAYHNDHAPYAEQWRQIAGTGYRVSNHGNILGSKGGILRSWAHRSGHRYVGICSEGKCLKRQVHRLVLLAFVGDPKPGQEALHCDGDPAHNHLINLRWGTRLDNIKDLIRTSGKSPHASVTYEIAAQVRAAVSGKRGDGVRAARAFGISQSTVSRIYRGESYAVSL
jgi:hypothetical protein